MTAIRLPHEWEPRLYQWPAWKYLQEGGRHAELIWHRRSGKDELSYRWASRAMFTRVGNVWHMLPQANQARKALWDSVNPHSGKRRLDEAFPHAVRSSTNEHDMMIKFVNGSTWQVVGSDNFNSLLGSPPVGLVFSEWALCDPASWAYLMPIIEENKGWVIFNSTPRGRNHAYRSLISSQKNPAHFAQILSANETPIFDAAQLAAIKVSLKDTYGDEFGESIFEQEYMVSFDAANMGAILGRWLSKAEREGRVDDSHDYDERGATLEVSGDIGRRDASAWFFWQPCMGGFTVFDHDKDSGLDADEWCDRLKKRITDRGYTLGHIWLPHDAKAKTFAAKHSAVEIFLNHFGADHVRIVPDSERADRINAARRVIRRCAFHRTKTEKGRDALAAWSYVYDEERKEFSKEPDHNWSSHDGDAFSYGALILEELSPPAKAEVFDITKVKGAAQSSPLGGFHFGQSLDEMWAESAKKKQAARI